MANPATGKVTFQFEGQSFTAVFDHAAIAAFEDETDVSIMEIAVQLAPGAARLPKLSTLGSLLAAALKAHHPHITREAGMAMVINPQVQQAMGLAMEVALPSADDAAEGGAAANPPKARGKKAGTGKR